MPEPRKIPPVSSNVLGKVFPNAFLSPRWDPVFSDGLTWRYLKANVRIWLSAWGFDANQAKRVFLIADSRGGSHLFESLFHYSLQ